MYCTKCGHKLTKNVNYCNKCGHKINANDNQKNHNINTKKAEKNLAITIGIISIILAILVNVSIIPLAIFGIVIGIKENQKSGTILNIIAIIISIIILTAIIFGFTQVNKYIKSIHQNNNQNNYENKYKYPKEDNIIVRDIIGTWYLYENNTLSKNIYYKFNSNNTYTYINNKDTYIGTYTITNNNNINNYEDNNNKSYYLTMKNVSLVKSDGNIVTENLEEFKYDIYLNSEEIQIRDIKTNNYFTLKKDVSIRY